MFAKKPHVGGLTPSALLRNCPVRLWALGNLCIGEAFEQSQQFGEVSLSIYREELRIHEYYGLNVFPPNSCVEALTPNMAVFGERQ